LIVVASVRADPPKEVDGALTVEQPLFDSADHLDWGTGLAGLSVNGCALSRRARITRFDSE
jgi:hypothetical protein